MIVLGTSLGGAIAMDFALEYPDAVEKLVLVDAQGFIDGLGSWRVAPRFLINLLVQVRAAILACHLHPIHTLQDIILELDLCFKFCQSLHLSALPIHTVSVQCVFLHVLIITRTLLDLLGSLDEQFDTRLSEELPCVTCRSSNQPSFVTMPTPWRTSTRSLPPKMQ